MIKALKILFILSAVSASTFVTGQESQINTPETEVSGNKADVTTTAKEATAQSNNKQSSGDDYSWKGFYFGGHYSYTSGKSDVGFEPLPSATQFNSLRPTTLSPDPKGSGGGVQVGYNFQAGHFVIGPEFDISGGSVKGDARLSPFQNNSGATWNGTLTASQKISWNGTVRVRAGAAFGRVLVYGTGGYAFAKIESTSLADFRPDGTIQYPATLSRAKSGWTAGAGMEVGVTKHLSFKGEYRYLSFGSDTVTANPVPTNPPFQVRYDWGKTTAQNAIFGLNFRF